MFEKITNKIINKTKETAKKEISKSVDEKIPYIIGTIILAIGLFSLSQPVNAKTHEVTKIVINNYYF